MDSVDRQPLKSLSSGLHHWLKLLKSTRGRTPSYLLYLESPLVLFIFHKLPMIINVFKVTRVLNIVLFSKGVSLQLFALRSWQALFFSSPFPLDFPFWPVLPSSLFVLWKSLCTYVMEHLCDENRQEREGMIKCLMINKLWEIFHTDLTIHIQPQVQISKVVSLRKYLQHKKAVLRPIWNVKTKSSLKWWHYKAKASFCKLPKQND